MEYPSDAELLTRLQKGDEGALDAILARYEQPLFLFLLGTLRDRHLAEDALQETFIQALDGLDGVSPDHLKGWLFTVAYHQGMLLRRKQALRQRKFPPAPVEAQASAMDKAGDPASGIIAQEVVERCQQLLNQLPPKQQEIIRLRLFEGKRFRTIAAELGCPLNTALARMHQGLKKLRELGEHARVDEWFAPPAE